MKFKNIKYSFLIVYLFISLFNLTKEDDVNNTY